MEPSTIGPEWAQSDEVWSVLRADGSAEPSLDPKLDPSALRSLYRAMVTARRAEERLASLSSEGKLAHVPTGFGAEAVAIGLVAGLEPSDWLFPTPRDHALALARGFSLEALFHQAFGTAEDAQKGRQSPGHLGVRALKIASASAPAATHLPQAVGFGWAARERGEALVTAALFDAAEVDAADFHTGLNFAGVMLAPTLFLCRVRGTISAADQAIAYGLPSTRCDGTDLLAVIRAVGEARARALAGEGSTVIDVVLNDIDPLARTRAHLEARELWGAEDEEALEAELSSALERAVRVASGARQPAPDSLFDDVFAARASHLDDQARALKRGRR